MKLVSDWSRVLRRAWSIRLVIAAGVLSAVEVALPFFEPSFPPGIFAAASGLAAGGAFVARLVAQKGLKNEE
jgi:hypothetical protein